MKAADNVKVLIEKVQSGVLTKYLHPLDDTDFGIYIPTYADQDGVKLMLEGYSQTEKNLVVTVSKSEDDALTDAKPVAWMGGQLGKDSRCRHGETRKCKHCTEHTNACRHCTHKEGKVGEGLEAPELDYDQAVKKLIHRNDLLDSLAKEQFGLTLLHGHNDQFMFTKLPENYVSVVANGVTSFRKEADVQQDTTFVPNIWRSVDGQFRVAGGYSEISGE